MKFVTLLLAIIALAGCSENKIVYDNTDDYDYVDIIVDLNDQASMAEISKLEADIGIDLKPNSPMFGKTKVMIATVEESAADELEDKLDDSDLVDGFGTNFQYTAHGFTSSSAPNDPMYLEGYQWNFSLVDAEKAWSLGATGKGVVVAVLDTGVSDGTGQYSVVPDLAKTCFVDGFNFVDDDSDPYDAYGHGTHVAGTIAQSTNNGYGVAGLAHEACLMSVKVLSDSGSGSLSDIVEGIIWAADSGANVLNMSLGGGPYSKVFEDAVKYAKDKNVFLTCSAGNSGLPVIEYPAGYDGCHAISAVGKTGKLAFYSSHGKSRNGNELFITAPGGDMREAGPEGGVFQDTIENGDPTKHGFFPFQGTSMSAPHVAGAAAMVISTIGVDKYTVESVEDVLEKSAKDLGDSDRFGAGLLNVGAAIEVAQESRSGSTSALTYILTAMLVAGAAILLKALKV